MTLGSTVSAEFKALLDQRRAANPPLPVDWKTMGPLLAGIVDKLAEESRLHEAEGKLFLAGEPKQEKAPPKAKRANPAGRNPLFDALALACGINPLEATPALRATVGVALADIQSVSPNVTPDEFKRRADGYKRKHKDWPLTPKALSKYWAELGPANGRTYAAEVGLEPVGWEDALRTMYSSETARYMIAQGWERLGEDIKAVIKKRISQGISEQMHQTANT